MFRSSLLLGLFALVCPMGLACASELEIPLTVVTPEDPITTQVVPFEIEVPIAQVSRIALRLQGTCKDQFFICDVPYHTATAPGRVDISMGDDVLVSQEVMITHSFPTNPGDPLSFEITKVLLEGDPADWTFLADGSSQLGIADNARLVYYEGAYPCSPVEVFGTLTGAALIVTYDAGVPVETRTWGTIKGIYR